MRKTKLFLAITAFTGILLSCHYSLEPLPKEKEIIEEVTVPSQMEDEVLVSLSLYNGTERSRTALPSIVWGDYEYTLKGKFAADSSSVNAAEENLLVQKKPFENFDNGNQLSLKKGYYIFTLTGYKDNTPVIEGVSSTIDLTSEGKTVSFRMYAKTGSTGKAKITLLFPDSVAKVSVWHSTNFLGTAGKDQEQDFTSFEDGSDNLKKIEYSIKGLPSGVNQYAQFRLYDSEGTLIASRSESIIVVGDPDKESVSTLKITMDALHTYNVSVSLTQNGTDWIYSKQEIVLKDKTTGKEYVLIDKDGDGKYDGTFTGTAAEGTFEIYIRTEGSETKTDLGLEFKTSEEQKSINFITVETPSEGGVQFVPDSPLSGGIPGTEENQYLIPEGGSGIEFTVEPKPGYEAAAGGITVSGSAPVDCNDEKAGIQIKLESTSQNITAGGTSVINYTISYELDGGSWTSGYSAPTSYNVENYTTVTLPKYGNLSQNGKDFDGWQDAGGAKFAALKEGQTGNLSLTAVWKTGVNIEGSSSSTITEEEKADYPDIKGKIFACGYSLIIKWENGSTASGKTQVYYDYNSDGQINGNDKLVDPNQDFTDFKLMAGTKDGEQPASDFKFTVLGGKLAGLEGLGKDKLNTSTVNISGNGTQIGNDKTGIILESLTNECVNVTGQMSGDYSITLVSSNKYEENHSYYKVAYISDPAYAQLSKFKCLYKTDNSDLLLSIMNQGSAKVIYLANPSPIALPPSTGTAGVNSDGGVIWIEDSTSETGYSKQDFKLGDTTTISIPCSVFSIAVSNGSFNLGSVVMKDEEGNTLSTDNLGQTSSGYETTLQSNTDYIYLHMFSQQNQISAARATEFLKQVVFKKASEEEPINISINLETVPYSDITSFLSSSGGTKFLYYDGSFYLNINEKVSWTTAYNKAKKKIFNGMNGYLITITSSVENTYIKDRLEATKAWTGGSRHNLGGWDVSSANPSSTDTFAEKRLGITITSAKVNKYSDYEIFYWQCGPEAGKPYWNGLNYNGSSPIDPDTGKATFQAWEEGEPNNYQYSGETNTFGETCMQFKSGTQWNDCPDRDSMGKSQDPESYIVEFRPYKTAYGEQKANYQSVSLSASY